MKCIAIDDEPLALDIISNYCENIPDVTLLQTFTSAPKGLDYAKKMNVDVVFLDINMPEITGLQLADMLHDKVQIVFVTAYEEHALDGFELSATDYLLKPVSFPRFYKAIQKCLEKTNVFEISEPQEIINPAIIVKVDRKLIRIHVDDIHFIQSLGDYITIRFGDNQKVVTRDSLKRLAKTLEPYKFIRVHRSYLVSARKITSINQGSITVVKQDIPIIREKREELIELFNRWDISSDLHE